MSTSDDATSDTQTGRQLLARLSWETTLQVPSCRKKEIDMSMSADVLEEGVTRGNCHKCSEKAGGKLQKGTAQDTGSLHDPWSGKVMRVKQEMEEENGDPRKEGTQLPSSFISNEWSYLCEVVLPEQPSNFRADDSSQTSDVEKKNIFIEDRIEGTSLESLNNSLVIRRRRKTDVDVTVSPVLEQADDVTYNKRITTESLRLSDKDNAPSYIDRKTNATTTLRDPQEKDRQSVGWSEIPLNKTLASPGASTASLKHIHTEIFRGDVRRRVIQSPVSGKCVKDSGEESLRSGGSPASWQGRQEANSQADIRDDKNVGDRVEGSTVLETLGDNLSKRILEDCIDEENANDVKLSKQSFTGQSSSLVISDQPVSLSLKPSTHPSLLSVDSPLLGFQEKFLRSEKDGLTSTSALVQRPLGRRKQVNPRQRPTRGQLSQTQQINVTQSENSTMKSDNDSETETNKNDTGPARPSQGSRRRSVSQETKFPHSNILRSKQRKSAVQLSLAPTGMSSLNESATRFIVPVLQSPSLPPQSPFRPSRPSPNLFQKIKSGLPLSPFCFQSSVEANFRARQQKEQEETRMSLDKDDRSALANSALSNPLNAAETSKPGNCKTGASPSLRQARANVITSPQSTGHRTIVTASPPTDTASLHGFCQSSNNMSGTVETTTSVSSPAASLNTTGLKAALKARKINMTALPSADSGSGCVYQQPSISEAYQTFGLGYKYKNIHSSVSDVKSSQEDLSEERELTGTESTEHKPHNDSASVSFLTSILRSSLKKKGQPRTKMSSSETGYQRGALDLTVDATRTTASHDVLNEHPLLQPIACKDVDAKKHTKQKSLGWSSLEIKKKELRIAARDDEAASGQNNTSASTSLGTAQHRNSHSNQKYCRGHVEVVCPDIQVAVQAEDAVQDGLTLEEGEVTKQESVPASVSQQQQKVAENSGEKTSICNISAVSALLQSLTAKTKDAEWTSQKDTTQAIESFPAVATLTHIVSEIKRKDNTGKKSAAVNKSKLGNVRSQGTKRALIDRVADPMIQGPLHGSVVADEHTGAANTEDTYNPQANQTNISSEKGAKAKKSKKSIPKAEKGALQLPSFGNSGLKLPIPSKTNRPSFSADNSFPMPSFPIPFGNVSFLPFQLIAHNIHMFTRHASNTSHGNTDTPSATIGKSDGPLLPARKEPATESPSRVKALGSLSTPCHYPEVDSEGSSVDAIPGADSIDYSPAPLAGVPQSGSGIPVFFFLPQSQLLTLGAAASGCSTEIFSRQQVVVPMKTQLAPKSTPARRPTQRLRKTNKATKVLPDSLSQPTSVSPQLDQQSVNLIENQTQPSVAQPFMSRTLEERVECPADHCKVVAGDDVNHEERQMSSYEISLNEGNNNSYTKHPQQCLHVSSEHPVPGARSTASVPEDKGRPTRQRRSVPNRYSTAIQEEELSEMSDFSEHDNNVSDDEWRPDNNNADLNSSSENETDADSDCDFDHNANRRSRKRSSSGTSRSRKIGSHNEQQKLQLVEELPDGGNGYVNPACFPLGKGRSGSEFRGSVSSTSCSVGTATSEASMSAVLQVRHSRPNRRRRRVPYTKEELTCRECSKVFANIYRLRRHEGSHREERPHICDICGKGFKQSGHRNEHRLTHDTVGRRSFLCHYCGVIINSRSSFRYHMMSHDQLLVDVANTNGAASENGVGDKTKDSTRSRKQPEATELRDKIRGDGATSSYTAYDCPHCPDRFATAQSLNSHLESHPEVALRCHVQPFMCEKCGRSFTYRHNLVKHRLLHVKPVKYADLYRRKVQEHISSGKPHFTCDTCGKVYLRKETLAKHCKTHLGIKPFQCHVCCKRFTQKIHLTVHSRLHTGIRPFQCRTCRCCFLDSTALARHVERDLCRQEGFSFNIGKRGRRPFHLVLDGDKKQEERKKVVNTSVLHCSLCKWRGKREGNLLNHMKRVHEVTPPVLVSDRPKPVVIKTPDDLFKLEVTTINFASLGVGYLSETSLAGVSFELQDETLVIGQQALVAPRWGGWV